MEILILLSTALLFGLRHAFDADHLVAVSTVTSQSKSFRSSLLVSAFWGAGHTLTLCICGLLLILFQLVISEDLAWKFEFLVAVMLVTLGVLGFRPLRAADETSLHGHSHSHSYWRSFLIGLLHGLAGSAALTLMIAHKFDNEWLGLLYIFIFGFGASVGMMVFSGVLVIPLCLGREKVAQVCRYLAATASIVVGLWLGADLCFSM